MKELFKQIIEQSPNDTHNHSDLVFRIK